MTMLFGKASELFDVAPRVAVLAPSCECRAALGEFLRKCNVEWCWYRDVADALLAIPQDAVGCFIVEAEAGSAHATLLREALAVFNRCQSMVLVASSSPANRNPIHATASREPAALEPVDWKSESALTVVLRDAFVESVRRRTAYLAAVAFRDALARLSEKECALVQAMIAGETIKKSARLLDVSTRTVERLRRNLLGKLSVRSIGQLGQMLARSEVLP